MVVFVQSQYRFEGKFPVPFGSVAAILADFDKTAASRSVADARPERMTAFTKTGRSGALQQAGVTGR